MREEVPAYGRLQQEVGLATVGLAESSVLDGRTGTGETLAAVLVHHPGVRAVGVDENEAMLGADRRRLAGIPLELRVADLCDELPAGRSTSSSRPSPCTIWTGRTRRTSLPVSPACRAPAAASSSATW
jgi:hypothetical protein